MNNEISNANEVRAFKTYIAWCERNEKIFSFISIIITLVIQFKPDIIYQYPRANFFWQFLITMASAFFECTFLFSSQIYFTKRLLYHNSSKEDCEFYKSFRDGIKLKSIKSVEGIEYFILPILLYIILPILLYIVIFFSLNFSLSNLMFLFFLVFIFTAIILSFWTTIKRAKIYQDESRCDDKIDQRK